eukprot:scaffold165534_cov19-Prasinocladus_malaysianus.AAC.1
MTAEVVLNNAVGGPTKGLTVENPIGESWVVGCVDWRELAADVLEVGPGGLQARIAAEAVVRAALTTQSRKPSFVKTYTETIHVIDLHVPLHLRNA